MVNMHIDTSDIRRRLGALERKANLVMAHAANGGVPVAVKFLKKEAAERYRLLQRDVTKTVSIKKALRGHPVEMDVARLRALTHIYFFVLAISLFVEMDVAH